MNTHHHLYQWITRGYAPDGTLFGWLTTLYPVWAGLDAELVRASAAANLGWLALSGRLGSGIARIRDLLAAGAPVGLGVDGSASNESGKMVDELHQALLAARYLNGPLSLSVRESLRLATMGGARCLGREDELGSLAAGKLADVALWQVGGLAGAGLADPLCTLVFGAPALDRLWVHGRPVVSGGRLVNADAGQLAAGAAAASARIGALAAGLRPS